MARLRRGTGLLALVIASASVARGDFLTAVDLDAGTPSFEGARTVAVDEVFRVNVALFTDELDPDLVFEAAILNVLFNSSGTVLELVPGSARAGDLVAFSDAPQQVQDAIGGTLPISVSDPIAFGSAGVPAVFAGTYATASGEAGLEQAEFGQFTVPATGFEALVTVYSAEFRAVAPGSTQLNAAGLSPFVNELMLGGAGIGADGLLNSTVSVIPEPSSFIFVAATLAAIAAVSHPSWPCHRTRR